MNEINNLYDKQNAILKTMDFIIETEFIIKQYILENKLEQDINSHYTLIILHAVKHRLIDMSNEIDIQKIINYHIKN